MNNKIKLIIFAIILILLVWLGIILFANPSKAATACGNSQAIWNQFVQNSPISSFRCMPAQDCIKNNFTMVRPSKASCPHSNERCCRPPDCTTIPPYRKNGKAYPYKCVKDSNPNKNNMTCDEPYRCPGGSTNTCCHDLPVKPHKKAPAPALPATPAPTTAPQPAPPTMSLSSCCSSIVPADTSINGLAQVIVNIYNCIVCVIGALTLLFVVLGGVILIISGGNSERIALGRKIIIGAIIGMLIVLTSVLIVNFVIKALGGTITI